MKLGGLACGAIGGPEGALYWVMFGGMAGGVKGRKLSDKGTVPITIGKATVRLNDGPLGTTFN